MSPVNPPAPSQITWEMAMNNAAYILSDLKVQAPKLGNPEWYSARASLAQAWIAFARELTMHSRVIR